MATATKQFGTLTAKNNHPTLVDDKVKEMLNYSRLQDRRMRFNNAQDPIYYVFDCIENRPVKTLAKEFVRDSFRDMVNFISMAVK